MSDGMHKITIEVTQSTWQQLVRDGKQRLLKPEAVAAAAVEDHARTSTLFDRRFADARREVERRLGPG